MSRHDRHHRWVHGEEFYTVSDEEAAEKVRRAIRRGEIAYEEMAAIIDSIAIARTYRDVWAELETHRQDSIPLVA